MRALRTLFLAILVAGVGHPALAQTAGAPTDLATWLEAAASESGPAGPLQVSPTAAAIARDNGLTFISEPPLVLSQDAGTGSALVLANGRVEVGNSGDDTSITHLDPSIFRVTRTDTGWTSEPVPMGRNRIHRHEMTVALDPARGLSVQDTMTVEVVDDDGFAFGLNRAATIRALQIDGTDTDWVFRNGLLWVDAPPGRRGVSVTYDLVVERDAGANSGVFQDDHGHLRNQYWWHPSLGLTNAGSRAVFDVTLTSPEAVHVALDFDQTSAVADGRRTTRIISPTPTGALSLAYDTAWVPRRVTAGAFTLDVFAAPDFAPNDAELAEALSNATSALSARFGVPPSQRMAVVQNRGRDRDAWAFLSNPAIHAGPNGAPFVSIADFPYHAPFAHEVAHLWTSASGDLQYLLTEGWATYAEGVVLEATEGPDVAAAFWEHRAQLLALEPDVLDTPLDQDAMNTLVSYHKGAWVFRMLETVLGQDAFDAGMRRFAETALASPAYEDFLTAFGDQAEVARRFLSPWISQSGVPSLDIVRENGRLFLIQTGPTYWLPGLEVELREGGRSERVRIDVEGSRTEVPTGSTSNPTVRIDPDNRFLILDRD
ncbi:M1 family aminopeptidase [Brevundimonas sp. AAP58]|uniref:M1 family aminopeptidase n=1 Tax=Brevundimonas sp. AAP58 TaxID=1523422 RepID=UPI000B04F39B|nr:M1 family aminopeptidase [Brevundimonas sp. AAP58]